MSPSASSALHDPATAVRNDPIDTPFTRRVTGVIGDTGVTDVVGVTFGNARGASTALSGAFVSIGSRHHRHPVTRNARVWEVPLGRGGGWRDTLLDMQRVLLLGRRGGI
ncbi:hypothetical protein RDE2_03570 [Rhodococcus sp. RDE2]|nr:hypothetical protein RDE2_03570 [Rhodococcus sp. RDE2]